MTVERAPNDLGPWLKCVRDRCDLHRHRWHPGQGHCESCIEDDNEGYGSDFTFSSRRAKVDGDDRCCCRDSRIGARWRSPEAET